MCAAFCASTIASSSSRSARREVERRSAAQLPDSEKAAVADYVVYNSGPLEETEHHIPAHPAKADESDLHSRLLQVEEGAIHKQ